MKLYGVYGKAFLGQLIRYIPSYIISVALTLAGMSSGGLPAMLVLSLICDIFIMDVFEVGYIRSLMNTDTESEGKKNYDINMVLSGFSRKYPKIVKVMFLRRVYMFGWGCLAVAPTVTAIGAVAFMSGRPEIAKLIGMFKALCVSPTADMLNSVCEYTVHNCAYVVYILAAGVLLSAVLMIPYIRKEYLYKAIPMITAENPDTKPSEAFCMTRELMNGNRMKYFLLELSFIGLVIVVSISSVIPVEIVSYSVLAAAMVYINMTFVLFYNTLKGNMPECAGKTEENYCGAAE